MTIIPSGHFCAVVVHPLTITRFGCYSVAEFNECLARVHENLRAFDPESWYSSRAFEPAVIDFAALSDAFVERTQLVSEKHALDAETRRAWVALRWCLHQYARRCTDGRDGYAGSARGGKNFTILLGESTSAEAWTDGQTYIACNVNVVRRLRTDPLRTAGYLFSLIDHEAAHEGDSLDCGHDEAFYQRFHDISISMADVRQRYIHVWMMKYTTSMEREGKKAAGKAWQERYLSDRVGNGREKRGLPQMIEDARLTEDIHADVAEENPLMIARLNLSLRSEQDPRPEPNWDTVMLSGILVFLKRAEAKCALSARDWVIFGGEITDPDCLALSRGCMLPPGAPPEEQSAQSAAWCTAIFWAALMHDLGSLEQMAAFYEDGRRWFPGLGMPEAPWRMKFCEQETNSAVRAATCAYRLIPYEGLIWVARWPALADALLVYLSGNKPAGAILHAAVSEAREKCGLFTQDIFAQPSVKLATDNNETLSQSAPSDPAEHPTNEIPVQSFVCNEIDDNKISSLSSADALSIMPEHSHWANFFGTGW